MAPWMTLPSERELGATVGAGDGCNDVDLSGAGVSVSTGTGTAVGASATYHTTTLADKFFDEGENINRCDRSRVGKEGITYIGR